MSDTPWIAPEHPDVVWFSGSDALRFLDDLVSQELEDMAPGEARRSLLLEPQGKLQFLLWVLMGEGRIGLATDAGRGSALAEALNRYRIRVDVDVLPEEGEVWVVVGDWDGFDVSWPGVERHLVIGHKPDLVAGSEQEYERLRILAGEPRWGIDVDEGTIPHSSGLVSSSVDFDKGCFLGQELVARMDSRGGNAPKSLLIVETGRGPKVGDPVTVDGEEVGTITSATDGAGLAMLKRNVSVGDPVEVGDSDGVVRELPAKT